MPVLELLQLRLRPGVSLSDPSLAANLSKVRSLVQTNSRFYSCIEDPSLVYILGQWPSLAAHQAFLASPEKEQILAHQTHQLAFCWMLHVELPAGVFLMADAVPFEAPVLAIARLLIKPDAEHVAGYQHVLDVHGHSIVEATRPYIMFQGWRVDGPPGAKEHIVMTGWASKESHHEFTRLQREANSEYRAVRDHYEGMEIVHCTNLER